VLVPGSDLVFANDLEILPDERGTILFTDSSAKHKRRDVFFEVLQAGGNGRLLAYNPRSGSTEVVLKGLHFPNGICLHADGDSVLFVELTLFRVMR